MASRSAGEPSSNGDQVAPRMVTLSLDDLSQLIRTNLADILSNRSNNGGGGPPGNPDRGNIGPPGPDLKDLLKPKGYTSFSISQLSTDSESVLQLLLPWLS